VAGVALKEAKKKKKKKERKKKRKEDDYHIRPPLWRNEKCFSPYYLYIKATLYHYSIALIFTVKCRELGRI